MRIFSWLATYLFVIALPVFIVTASVRFLVNEDRVASYGFRENAVSTTMDLPVSELEKVSRKITDYFNDNSEFIQVDIVLDGKQTAFFGEVEVVHLRDVKALLGIIFRLSEISLAVVLTYIGTAIFIHPKRRLIDLTREIALSIGVSSIFLLAVLGYVLFDFDSAWTQFHEIVFTNDFWLLNPATDRLIQMYPEKFWETATLVCVILIGGQMLLVGGSSAFYFGFKKGWLINLHKRTRHHRHSHRH